MFRFGVGWRCLRPLSWHRLLKDSAMSDLKHARANRGVTAHDVLVVAEALRSASLSIDAALTACGGKIKTPYMDDLLHLRRKVNGKIFQLEHDWLELSGSPRTAPLLGEGDGVEGARAWLSGEAV